MALRSAAAFQVFPPLPERTEALKSALFELGSYLDACDAGLERVDPSRYQRTAQAARHLLQELPPSEAARMAEHSWAISELM